MVFKSMSRFLPVIISAGLVFISSCKKDDGIKWTVQDNPDKQICISIKDYATNQPVAGATATIDVNDWASSMIYTGVSDASGNTCIIYDNTYLWYNEIRASAPGYEEYCDMPFGGDDIPSSLQILLLKRDSYIRFHFVNVPPVYAQDSLRLYLYSNINYCSGQGQLQILPGAPADTTIIYSSVSGSIDINWWLYRNNSSVSNSYFNVTVPLGDTLLVDVNY
jgi:hypothetical protein